jgi:phosphoribosylamine--glycine ligase
VVEGLDAAAAHAGVTVFHAGTARDGDGRVVTAGGRVLAVTGVGAGLGAARERAYAAAREIWWPGQVVRGDIAGAP